MDSSYQTFALDKNEVKLSRTGGRLLIEVEDTVSQRNFSIELDNDAIVQASNEIFTDVDTMYNGLQEALKKLYKEVSISFDGKGKLAYTACFSFGAFKKDHNFVISLQEKSLNPLAVLERRVDVLTQELEKLKGHPPAVKNGVQHDNIAIVEMINKLEKRIFEKFDDIEKRISALEQPKLLQKTDLKTTFDPSTSHAVNFVFKNNNQTIQRSGKDYYELPISNTIPRAGKLKLSFKIEKMSNWVWIGVASVDKINLNHWYKSEVRYLTTKGNIEIEGGSKVYPPKISDQGYGKAGDTISMVLDVKSGLVSFEINNFEVNSIGVNMKEKSYFPYLGFGNIGDEVTFLSSVLTQ